MPLSEQEQRLLEEMERSLYHNDADFVATVSARRGRPNYRRIAVGSLIAVAGVVAIATGIMIKQPIVGVLGFVVIIVGILLGISHPRNRMSADSSRTSVPSGPSASGTSRSGSSSGASGSRGGSRSGGSFMDRMNERWDRRQDDRD
ncbi:MAG: hypothetical protein JWP30_107 [Homoserinimonas sp.]|jgi:uncharacterized membrane protein YgcG|nr:hypothetical protein [Homoserinimonas sp.]